MNGKIIFITPRYVIILKHDLHDNDKNRILRSYDEGVRTAKHQTRKLSCKLCIEHKEKYKSINI